MLNPSNEFPNKIIQAVLLNIQDGFVFEGLVKKLLQEKYGWKFNPVGGIHDGSVDCFVYFGESNNEIMQVSIQKTWKNKIRGTIEKLKKAEKLNDITSLTYITPLGLSPLEKSDIIEDMRKEKVILGFKDQEFIVNLINSSYEIRSIFSEFCDQHSIINALELESMDFP